jgi:hypothetical protein
MENKPKKELVDGWGKWGEPCKNFKMLNIVGLIVIICCSLGAFFWSVDIKKNLAETMAEIEADGTFGVITSEEEAKELGMSDPFDQEEDAIKAEIEKFVAENENKPE